MPSVGYLHMYMPQNGVIFVVDQVKKTIPLSLSLGLDEQLCVRFNYILFVSFVYFEKLSALVKAKLWWIIPNRTCLHVYIYVLSKSDFCICL